MRIRRSRWWWLSPWCEIRRVRNWGRHWRHLYHDLVIEHFKATSELEAIKRQRSETSRKGAVTKALRRQMTESTD